MAKRSRQMAHDSSDDEAPEAVSFGSSKRAAKGEHDALQQHHKAQKQKQKEKNRAIDRALKDRSANAKGKGKEVVVRKGKPSKNAEVRLSEDEVSDDGAKAGTKGGPSREELEERMARAMMEAEDESGSQEGDEGFTGSEGDVEMDSEDEEISDEDGGSEDEDEEENEELLEEGQSDGDEDEDGDEESSEEDEDVPLARPTLKDDYLPDYLFKSAFSHTGKKIVFDDDDPLLAAEAPPPRKRRRTKHTSKDILIGSRTVRALPKANAVASSVVVKGLAPPRRVDKFVKTSLNLKGDVAKAKSKGWNRQPANLGVMKRHGPAAHFVRAS